MTTIVRPHGGGHLESKMTTCKGFKRDFPKVYRRCPYCKKVQAAK